MPPEDNEDSFYGTNGGAPPPVRLVTILSGGNVQIRSAQKLAWENKVAKGFNTTDVPLEFCLLQGEIAEAFDASRKGRETSGKN